MSGSFPRIVDRDVCFVCHTQTGGNPVGTIGLPKGEAGKIRLYEGIPLCWRCAYKIQQKFKFLEESNDWKIYVSKADEITSEITDDQTEERGFSAQIDRYTGFKIIDTQVNDVTPTNFDIPISMSSELAMKFIDWMMAMIDQPESRYMALIKSCGFPVILPSNEPLYMKSWNDATFQDFMDPMKRIASVKEFNFDFSDGSPVGHTTLIPYDNCMSKAILRKDVMKNAILRPYLIIDGDRNIVNLIGFVLYLEDEQQ